MRVSLSLKMFAVAILAFLFCFTTAAFAATAAMPDDSSNAVSDALKMVYDAFTHGHYLAAGMAALLLTVALLKRYAPDKYGIKTFVHGDVGGALLTLVASFAGAMATALANGGFTWSMAKAASLIAVGAAGGYSLIKKLVIVPFLRPWAAKAPSWLKPILQVVLWIFDKPSDVEAAEKAGDAAVAAKPADGLKAVVGAPKDVE